MEIRGHSQISLTLDTYSHVMPGMRTAAANKLARILTPEDPPGSAEMVR
jgi:hypothetical protein